MGVYEVYVVFFAHEQLGYSLYLAGLLLLVSEVGGSAGRLLWGVISDRFFGGRRLIVLVLIALVTAVCSVVTAWLSAGVPFWVVLSLIALFWLWHRRFQRHVDECGG